MKRKFLAFIIILAAVCGVQQASAQFRWGATVGVNFNDFKFKQAGILSVGKGFGESAGINGEMMFPGIGFGIDIGLRYEQLGAKLNLGDFPLWESQGYSADERIYIHNIQIPFNLKFKYTRLQGFEDYLAPFVFGGPVFNIQAAHSKCDAMKFSGGDLGLTVGAGAEIFRRWQLSASYTWGMTYALKAKVLTDYSARNRTWDIRLTYYF
ncbi:porin family protein [uncultured Duncaniella sp.]|uniref:porin family protein n=1 Tax=uncultured Duncaniella sp. TaxID=2768039 RepID=UPI0023C033F4|nr:porin family protein [uncultured Duncaniella sp.]MDE5915309.1 PorT family protein [Duncaniella sp.]MDE5953207.1 PorT family protein [Duncaniella sp.]MDE5961287.1 PorT family protein [Duncaniella sp.]MDE6187607.1 PorT family protein [Duncaniella sp.]